MHIIERPVVPFNTPIYNGMNHDALVDIHGDIFQGPNNGFVVEFPSREGTAFHISVRMGLFGENTIVMNNMKHGRWKREERHHNCFSYGQVFHLHIANHHHHFSIHVNGRHVAHFHHRESPHDIQSLTIKGDVRVHKVHFENFTGFNGGGIQIGSMPAPMVVSTPAPSPVVMAPPAPSPVIIAPPAPTPQVIMAPPPPRPTPIIAVVEPPRPQPVIMAPPVVVIEEDHHHRHHHHHHHHRHGW